jgi:hypothetical protein
MEEKHLLLKFYHPKKIINEMIIYNIFTNTWRIEKCRKH